MGLLLAAVTVAVRRQRRLAKVRARR